jgi:hypothetical protein
LQKLRHQPSAQRVKIAIQIHAIAIAAVAVVDEDAVAH